MFEGILVSLDGSQTAEMCMQPVAGSEISGGFLRILFSFAKGGLRRAGLPIEDTSLSATASPIDKFQDLCVVSQILKYVVSPCLK